MGAPALGEEQVGSLTRRDTRFSAGNSCPVTPGPPSVPIRPCLEMLARAVALLLGPCGAGTVTNPVLHSQTRHRSAGL